MEDTRDTGTQDTGEDMAWKEKIYQAMREHQERHGGTRIDGLDAVTDRQEYSPRRETKTRAQPERKPAGKNFIERYAEERMRVKTPEEEAKAKADRAAAIRKESAQLRAETEESRKLAQRRKTLRTRYPRLLVIEIPEELEDLCDELERYADCDDHARVKEIAARLLEEDKILDVDMRLGKTIAPKDEAIVLRYVEVLEHVHSRRARALYKRKLADNPIHPNTQEDTNDNDPN